jgi:L-ribulokinase
MAAGTFKTIEEAQDKICPSHRAFLPDDSAQRIYDDLYPLYSRLYFALGQRGSDGLGDILPSLMAVAASSTDRTSQ